MNTEHKTGLVLGSMMPGHEERQVDADWKTRSVPIDVFCYPRPDLWRDRVWQMLGDFITEDVKSAFTKNPPEYVVSDDLTWLNNIVETVTGACCDMKSLMADILGTEYRAFRLYHATRTNDLAQFYSDGLRIPKNAEIEDCARNLFLNGQYESATEARLQAAISDLNEGQYAYRSDVEARAYCCADERAFTTRAGGCGHYLEFGSEYLLNLAIRVEPKPVAHAALRARGSPTLFVIDAPMPLLSIYTLKEFAGNILEYLFCELVDDLETSVLSPSAGSGIILRNPIPADAFVGHYHPAT